MPTTAIALKNPPVPEFQIPVAYSCPVWRYSGARRWAWWGRTSYCWQQVVLPQGNGSLERSPELIAVEVIYLKMAYAMIAIVIMATPRSILSNWGHIKNVQISIAMMSIGKNHSIIYSRLKSNRGHSLYCSHWASSINQLLFGSSSTKCFHCKWLPILYFNWRYSSLFSGKKEFFQHTKSLN